MSKDKFLNSDYKPDENTKQEIEALHKEGVSLSGVQLKYADMRSAKLVNADLSNSDLTRSDFSGASLYGVNLEGANLFKANFEGVNLKSTNMRNCNLLGVDFTGAKLNNVDWGEENKVINEIDAENALVGISRNPPDLAVIDIKMPRMDGEELLKRLRKKTAIPIIFLTSKDEEVDELLGLKLGADDFIKKSGGFSIKVLIERIRVQLRKKTNNIDDSKNLIKHGKLVLDPSQLECEWDGKSLPEKLTTTEFLIVKELAKRPGIIKERAQLMDIAYKDNNDIEDRTIDSHVKRIRKKFKKVDLNFSAIETRYGSGYRWNIS